MKERKEDVDLSGYIVREVDTIENDHCILKDPCVWAWGILSSNNLSSSSKREFPSIIKLVIIGDAVYLLEIISNQLAYGYGPNHLHSAPFPL